jgi:hypothetical protein
MAVGDVLVDVWQNGGQVVVLGGAGFVIAAARSAPGQVKSNDRRVEALGRDLRRWLHDRDRELTTTQKLIKAYARNPDLQGPLADQLVALRAPVPEQLKHLPAGSQYHSGAHIRWQVRAKETALQQYRDRATETIDQLDEIRESEGWSHGLVRKRRGLSAPEVKLSSAERDILTRWRADVDLGNGMTGAVTDASRADGEERFRELEE